MGGKAISTRTMPGRITDIGIDKYTENRRQLRVSLIMSKHTAFVKKENTKYLLLFHLHTRTLKNIFIMIILKHKTNYFFNF